MSMNKIERLQAKIQKIQTLCAEVLAELEELRQEKAANQSKQSSDDRVPAERECQEEFDRLYGLYLSGSTKAIDEFVKAKSKDYLKVFCKANSLSVDIKKVGKEKIADEIRQWFAQRKAISGT